MASGSGLIGTKDSVKMRPMITGGGDFSCNCPRHLLLNQVLVEFIRNESRKHLPDLRLADSR
jgi:hypothetical protein